MTSQLKQQIMKNKTLISIQVSSVVDIITNSSSELFVLKGEERGIVEEMIKNIYPNYTQEYKLEKLSESDKETKESYIDWVYDTYGKRFNWRDTKDEKIKILTDEASSFNLTPDEFFSNWDERNGDYYYPDYSDKGIDLVLKKLDPENNIYCLWSEDENPDWDMQEKLMTIGTRYHLG